MNRVGCTASVFCFALLCGISSRAADDPVALLSRATPLVAQELQVSYPLFDDLADATGNYGDVTLYGNPTPPTPPDGVDPLCLNGIYLFDPGGQDMQTPNIFSLDETDLQIDIQFILNELPSFWTPVIMIGPNWRWFGLYIDGDGLIGAKYNNSFIIWSSTTIEIDIWHAAQLKYESGVLQIVLDGAPIMLANIGPLTTEGDYIFTCNDFSNGAGPLNGCIRNLNIYNDTTIVVEGVFADGFESGDTSAWSATVP
jgi:hypothetical protein